MDGRMEIILCGEVRGSVGGLGVSSRSHSRRYIRWNPQVCFTLTCHPSGRITQGGVCGAIGPSEHREIQT